MVRVNLVQPAPDDALVRRHSRRLASTRGLGADGKWPKSAAADGRTGNGQVLERVPAATSVQKQVLLLEKRLAALGEEKYVNAKNCSPKFETKVLHKQLVFVKNKDQKDGDGLTPVSIQGPCTDGNFRALPPLPASVQKRGSLKAQKPVPSVSNESQRVEVSVRTLPQSPVEADVSIQKTPSFSLHDVTSNAGPTPGTVAAAKKQQPERTKPTGRDRNQISVHVPGPTREELTLGLKDACGVEQESRWFQGSFRKGDSGVEKAKRPSVRSRHATAVRLGEDCGWVRVFTGGERPMTKGTLVYLTLSTTAADLCRDLLLPQDLAIWMQHGGAGGRRVLEAERPLQLQDAFLKTLGYGEASRRQRLGMDPELRHLLRFHVGPREPRGGCVHVLKGLVLPQWRPRTVALLASKLFIYPAAGHTPEVVELCGGAVVERPPRGGKLVLRLTPVGAEGRHLFVGFHQPWERDLWRDWLIQATQQPATPTQLDLSGGGLEAVPASLAAFPALLQLSMARNRLGAAGKDGLAMLAALPCLRALSLADNGLRDFPTHLLQVASLVSLDLSGNKLTVLPHDICRLHRLQELRLERNSLQALPGSVSQLEHLASLHLGHNRLEELPSDLLGMRSLALLDLQSNRLEASKVNPGGNSLGKVNLRNTLLKGNIQLANYGNLTQLDVSENSIETLDLSALSKLEAVQCSKNQLVELSLNGKSLVSLIAGNNKLHKLSISPPPSNLQHLDISYNDLELLPNWLPGCCKLRTLFASHNRLHSLPDQLLNSESNLLTLQLSYNQIAAMPTVNTQIPLQELFLQGNSIAMLPTNFFATATRLRVLNMSNNRLCELPVASSMSENYLHQIEKLYLTANCLTDKLTEVIKHFRHLRVLHAAYNCLTILPESCIKMWKDLEELVLSGNKLSTLPDNIIYLKHLRILRVHSNQLQTSPCFAKMTSLKVLDLAHNQLDRINLATLVPQQLQFLDLSCNTKLYVDPRQFQVYRTQRPMSLIDVSGQNRTCLPSTPCHEGDENIELPWKVGFSETAGSRERLYVTQIRLPAFCNTEGLFGVFDGENNNEIPNILTKTIPRILLEERTVKETASEYMKYTMLSAHRELKEKGQKYGVCATLCHISRLKSTGNVLPQDTPRYVLRIATVGEAKVVLCRCSEGITLANKKRQASSPNNMQRTQLGCSTMFPIIVPDPEITEIVLEEQDEFLIIANKRFWEVMSVPEAIDVVRHMNNALLAAKKLQDLAQSYGCEENISILVIWFSNPPSGVEQLMRELRHTIRRNYQHECTCCLCPANSTFYQHQPTEQLQSENSFKPTALQHRILASRACTSTVHGVIPDTDRSSPSGQSDQASSDSNVKKSSMVKQQHWDNCPATKGKSYIKTTPMARPPQSVLMHENGVKKMSPVVPLERRSYRDSKRSSSGVLKAIRAKIDGYSNGHLADAEEEETGSDRSGTQLSEEQFKCWEYMLEQNTQVLFDKELDTLSRGFLRPRSSSTAALLDPMWPQPNTSLHQHQKALSNSSPHLADTNQAPAPFLSRHFGSARSFNPVSKVPRFGSGRYLNGGPNAAYFGSLQRLMPYNLEYNFSIIQERNSNQDSLECDGRMQQYWGVTTTEL